ncbi:MAG TPA: hypothetical protein P5316_21730 [Phycisphaerae bacterium]|nr:hypothetical protein [Phycisphaerae bacterium]
MSLIDLVKSKVKDDSGRLTDDDDYSPAVAAALAKYSKDRPGELVDDVNGAGTHDVDLPDGWVEGFSRVSSVEYPVGLVPEAYLPERDWRIYRGPDGPVLRLLREVPSIGSPVRVTITVPRVEADIVSGDLDAVGCLAASFCCETLANLFAQTSDPTIAADVVNYRTKSGEFAARGKRLRQLYLDHLGIDADGGFPAASVKASAPETDRVRLTH